ncbi:MAG: hypothetical protein P1V20_32395 [Verrucomicrobiales bacterium]|nr:hypothetical protein [Verrucomicrobiales bacterium]
MKYAVQIATLIFALPALMHGQRVSDDDTTFKVYPDHEGHSYFPEGRESYYTRYLAAMKEPSLFRQLPDGIESIYRLTILPSFSDRISIRISKKGESYEMRSIQLKCGYNHEPEKIVRDETRILKQDVSGPLIGLLSRKELWVEFTDLEEAVMNSVRDGVTYIFEESTKNGYKMLDPHTPAAVVQYQETDQDFSDKDFRIYDKIVERIMRESGLPVEANLRL